MNEKEKINQLKAAIENYENENSEMEHGIVLGMFYALNLFQHGKEYADQKIKMPKKCSCEDGKECGC